MGVACDWVPYVLIMKIGVRKLCSLELWVICKGESGWRLVSRRSCRTQLKECGCRNQVADGMKMEWTKR